MTRNSPNFGECHLCGERGKLSFEHVPPAAAFNDRKVLLHSIEKLINSPDVIEAIKNPVGAKYSQRGMGAYTLCISCNNNTGGWYAKSYVSLVHEVMPIVHDPRAKSGVEVELRIPPLSVLKQILTMFCSTNSPRFSAENGDIRRYLLNKEARNYPEQLRVYLALIDMYETKILRRAGLTGILCADDVVSAVLISEIIFPPFALILSVESEFDNPGFQEISQIMKNFDYGEIGGVKLKVSAVASTTYYPGDFRRIDEIHRDRMKNKNLD
jgi:hypothetical protein